MCKERGQVVLCRLQLVAVADRAVLRVALVVLAIAVPLLLQIVAQMQIVVPAPAAYSKTGRPRVEPAVLLPVDLAAQIRIIVVTAPPALVSRIARREFAPHVQVITSDALRLRIAAKAVPVATPCLAKVDYVLVASTVLPVRKTRIVAPPPAIPAQAEFANEYEELYENG